MLDLGFGPVLLPGGRFSNAGGTPAVNVALWDGLAWSTFGTGLGLVPPTTDLVTDFELFDDGTGAGERLYALGRFTTTGLNNIAFWDGANWQDVGGGVDDLSRQMLRQDDLAGSRLIVAGNFLNTGGPPASYVTTWLGCASEFVRGDANADNFTNIADAIWIIEYLFQSGPIPICLDSADSNNDAIIDVSDVIYLIQWQFQGGPAPPAPYPGCGLDTEFDALDCFSYPGC